MNTSSIAPSIAPAIEPLTAPSNAPSSFDIPTRVSIIGRFLRPATRYEMLANCVTLLMGVCTLVILVIVGVDLTGLVNQQVSWMLQAKLDPPVQILQNALSAMVKLDTTVAPSIGFANLEEDQVFQYKLSLAPKYPSEQQTFPAFIDAIGRRRYRVLYGQTQGLWSRLEQIESKIGGIDYAMDWWDVIQSTVDVQGSILFTGVSLDAALLFSNYSTALDMLGLKEDNPEMSPEMVDRLLLRSGIPKLSQVGSLLCKLYATDPQKLVSFNLRVATDGWLSNVSAIDLRTNAKCHFLPTSTFAQFQGFWCPRTFYPSDAYKNVFVNGTVGNWVVECDTPEVDVTLDNIRWHAQMRSRYATAFHLNSVRIRGPRKVIFSQTTLAKLLRWQGNASVTIQ